MFSRRNFVSAVALAILSAISLAAATQAYFFRLSAEATLSHAELIAWLTTSGGDWKQDLERLPPAARDRLMENYLELSQAWMLDKVDRYYELREPERTEYLDSQIDGISRWPMLNQNEQPLLGGDPSRNLAMLQGRFSQLKPEQQRRVQQFMGALYMRWLARGFRQLIPLVPDET
jgi:hypothetical protein